MQLPGDKGKHGVGLNAPSVWSQGDVPHDSLNKQNLSVSLGGGGGVLLD